MELQAQIVRCRLCEDRFAATATAHAPRPVVWFGPNTSILIAGQAPGAKVQASGKPFTDPSGDRLRDWMGLAEAEFYDTTRVSIVPMAFCFPGYNAAGSDLPPPPICAKTWRKPVMAQIGQPALTLLVGGYAQRWHFGDKMRVTDRVAAWRRYGPHVFPLPHPSWRNSAWIKANPWFMSELIPALRHQTRQALKP